MRYFIGATNRLLLINSSFILGTPLRAAIFICSSASLTYASYQNMFRYSGITPYLRVPAHKKSRFRVQPDRSLIINYNCGIESFYVRLLSALWNWNGNQYRLSSARYRGQILLLFCAILAWFICDQQTSRPLLTASLTPTTSDCWGWKLFVTAPLTAHSIVLVTCFGTRGQFVSIMQKSASWWGLP